MSQATNQLVNEVKKMARKPLSLGAGAVLTAALAVSLVFHESAGHAASVNASPIDDNSVAALTALDHAMEAVAAHVQPAVVNVQVTSKGSEEETSQTAARSSNCLRASRSSLDRTGRLADSASASRVRDSRDRGGASSNSSSRWSMALAAASSSRPTATS